MPAAPHFVTVFDIGQVGFRNWVWWGLIGYAAAIPLLGLWQWWRDEEDPNASRKAGGALFFLVFAVPVVGLCYFSALSRYHALQTALARGKYQVEEGVVHDFRFGKTEKFDVGNVEFSYSGNDLSSMFNTTTAGGLPAINGREVRIAHVGNDIVRLDVAQ